MGIVVLLLFNNYRIEKTRLKKNKIVKNNCQNNEYDINY